MEILIALATLSALVWLVVFAVRGSLMTACLVYLLVNECFGYYFYNFNIGSTNMTLDRPVLVLVACLFVVHRVLCKTCPQPPGRADYALFALMTWLCVRTFTADWQETVEGQISPLWYLLAGYLAPVAIYWIARQIRLDLKQYRAFQTFYIVLGAYLAVTGLFEVTGQWWAVFPKHISDPGISQHFGRARGPMVNSIPFGFCLSVSVLCVWQRLGQAGRLGKLLLAALFVVLFVGIYISYTRVVWLGAIAGTMVILGLTLDRRQKLLALGGVAICSLLVLVTQWDRIMAWDAGRVAAHAKESSDMRASFTYVGWQMFQDQPLVGCGLGQYVKQQRDYLSDRTTELRLESIRHHPLHNLVLGILVETGLIGFMLFVTVFIVWGQNAWGLYHNAAAPGWARFHGMLMLSMIAVYFAHSLFHPIAHTYTVQMLMFFLAGLNQNLHNRFELQRRNRYNAQSLPKLPRHQCLTT